MTTASASGSGTAIAPETVQAYLESDYQIHDTPPFILRVETFSATLQQAHRARHVNCSAFITAWNPRSQLLDPATNHARQAELQSDLAHRGLIFLQGAGSHPSCPADGEPGLLVFGLELEAGKALARRWDQNALLWTGFDAVPRLILLR